MPVANDNLPTPTELAKRIRDKIADLNDELILAPLIEMDVEFEVGRYRDEGTPVQLRVWCSQEVTGECDANELARALNALLTSGALHDPENDPKITAAIREAMKTAAKAKGESA